jgi:hypothetical protein
MSANATEAPFLKRVEVDASSDQLAFDELHPALRKALREHPLRLCAFEILKTLARTKPGPERTYMTQRLLVALDNTARQAAQQAFEEGRA